MENLYRNISKRVNYIDENLVKNVYYAIIKEILANLKDFSGIRLPDFGKFEIIVHKERRIGKIRTKELVVVPPTKLIKFYPCEKLKNYIKKM